MQFWYDYQLVALSVVVAIIASQVSLSIAARIKAHRSHAIGWLAGGATAMGIGIWAMHFMGMLAYHLPIPVGYDIPLTVFSLLLAIISSLIALYVIFSAETLSWESNAFSALIMGAGIAGMHYTGIYAMQMSPAIEFDPTLFLASLVIAYVASFVAIRLAFYYSKSDSFFELKKGLAAILMGFAISGMHYTAMGAQIIDPDAVCLAANSGLNAEYLAVLVISVVLLVLIITAILLNTDLTMAHKEKDFAVTLAKENERSLLEARQLAVELTRESLRNAEFANKLVDTLGALVIVIKQDGTVIRFNRTAEEVTGYNRHEVLGHAIWRIMVGEEQQSRLEREFSDLKVEDFPRNHSKEWMTQSGDTRVIDWSDTVLLDDSGHIEFIIATGIDVTEQRHNEEELKIAAVAFNTNEAIFVTDRDNNILRANSVFTDITGYGEEEVIGENPSILKSGEHESDFYHNMWSKINAKGYWIGEIWNKKKSGEVFPEFLRITAVKNRGGDVENYVASFSDLTQLKQAEEKLSYVTNYDQVTGLPNRQLFGELLRQEMATTGSNGKRGLVIYMRFIDLGLMNQSLGVSVVDTFINHFIAYVRSICESNAVLGRASGSSFILMLPRIEESHGLSEYGSYIAGSILEHIKSGELIDEKMVSLGVNLGIAAFPNNKADADTIIQNASVAHDEAKKIEASSYHFFSEELHKAAIGSYSMLANLRSAITSSEFELYYQPQVDVEEKIIGAEALLRWKHDGNFVSPAEFIPIAERSDLIHEIGDFVFRDGISFMAELIRVGVPKGFECISLNMSAKQFHDTGFIEKLKKYLIEHAVPPEYIKIELTETALVDDPQQAIDTIAKLKELGIRISLDDFGTGYSSLSYLHRIPIDQLKVDQSFVRDMTINKVSRSITETIVMMANSMGIDVIAEGVETLDEKEMLGRFGCFHYQGYYFYKPMNSGGFVELLISKE